MPTIVVESHNGVARVTLNRPESRNAVSLAMWREIAAVFGRWPTTPPFAPWC